ncbi:hypothetical protein LPJ66_008346 [Kickxella alabastrina]|uniref:Uncharacterized protein n=1 Tax=Kickxella alabastrina TaxID=61397 RepID=A0ACC1I6Z4_9FUNG|nr:hypothetical protein LPJ66_008346 [Kickxella alabastrina]
MRPVNLPISNTASRQSQEGSAQSRRQQNTSNPRTIGISSSSNSPHNVSPPNQTIAQRPSIEVRHDAAMNGPAKARMLWRESFTPHEIENSSINEKEVRRQEVIFEIIHTEADYVKDLRIIVDILLGPMRSLRIVPADQIELIFGNVQEILELHESINTAFMERQRKQYPVVWDISDVLLPFVHHFRLYAKYICNQDKALGLVEELKRTSNNFAVFCKERQRRPECRNLPMESFLTLPFQRLLKYPLLLRTLLTSTEQWSQQHANGRLVAEQVDAWIKKIQDARAKLESYACLQALSACVSGVNWAPLLHEEHRLMHSGTVRTTNPKLVSSGSVLPPDEVATMWLFESFALIARAEPVPSGPKSMLPRSSFPGHRGPDASTAPAKSGCMPAPNTRYSVVLGPCKVVEVLELAQCKGAPDAYLRAIPFEQPAEAEPVRHTSAVVRFASKPDYMAWRPRLNAHVCRTLHKTPSLSADVLADAIARARFFDSDEPPAQLLGQARSPPSSGFPTAQPSAMASVSDIPTISVREVFVEFPATVQKGKIRRGWDFLCSKTEDITGQGIKRQLKKYGGGGGKRRATDLVPAPAPAPNLKPRLTLGQRSLRGSPQTHSQPHLAPPPPPPMRPSQASLAASQVISTPIIRPMSPSYVHIPMAPGLSAVNGAGEEANAPKAASHTATVMPQRRRLRNQTLPALGIYHPQVADVSSATVNTTGNSSSTCQRTLAGSVDNIVLQSYSNYSCRGTGDGEDMVLSSPQAQQFSKFEVGSATLAYSSSSSYCSDAVSAAATFAGTTLSANTVRPPPPPHQLHNETYGDMDMSDSDISYSEHSPEFPRHIAESSGSTLFHPPPVVSQSLPQMQQAVAATASAAMRSADPQAGAPLRVRMSRVSTGLRMPAPVFEVGSAKLTYGNTEPYAASTAERTLPKPVHPKSQNELRTWGSKAHEVMSNMPGFQSDQWHAYGTAGHLLPVRSWQPVDADEPSSANSTDSFCIVNHEPMPPPPALPPKTQALRKQTLSRSVFSGRAASSYNS